MLVGIATVVGLLGISAGAAVIVAAGAASENAGVSVPVVSTGSEVLPDAASAVVHGAGMPGRVPVVLYRDGALKLEVYEGVPVVTRILGAGWVWASAMAAGIAVLLLVPVLRSTASRDPFAQGNARQLALAACTVLVGWAAASALPVAAAASVVSGLPAQAGAWEPVFRPDYWPLGFVAFLAALSSATWQGSRLAADTEGLV